MGNNESTPPPQTKTSELNTSKQLNDEMFEKISTEVKTIFANLETLRVEMTKDAYLVQKKQMQELSLKLNEFYRFAQINDDMIKQLSTEKAGLGSTLNEYKKELLKFERENKDIKQTYEQNEQNLLRKCSQLEMDLSKEVSTSRRLEREKQNLVETYSQKEQNLLGKVSHLQTCLSNESDAKTKIERNLQIHKRNFQRRVNEKEVEIGTLRNDIQKLRDDFCNQKELRQKAESELLKKENQPSYQHVLFKQLEERLADTQFSLAKEQSFNKEGSVKLALATQYSERLQKRLDEKETQLQNNTAHFKEELFKVENQLTKTRINLNKSRKDVKHLETIKKNIEEELKTKQRQIDDLFKLLNLFPLEKPEGLEEASELNKLFLEFVSKHKNCINQKLYASNMKQEEIRSSYEEEICKYEKMLKELKDELRLSDRKLKSEETFRKEIQGKLFLLEKNSNALKKLCKEQLQHLKKFVNKNKNAEIERNVNKKEFVEATAVLAKEFSRDEETEVVSKKVGDEHLTNIALKPVLKSGVGSEKFYADENEISDMQKELETLLTDI